MEVLKEIRVQHFNKPGLSTNAEDEKLIRVSIYFDYTDDNHHVQFPAGANRSEVHKALVELSKLITNYNSPYSGHKGPCR